MLRDETVFVVGAGASYEYGLPIGATLAQAISRKLDLKYDFYKATSGDAELFDSIQLAFHNEMGEYQQAGWLIRDGIVLANSIDDFLDVHQHDGRVVRLGKAAIAKCILEAERSSKLHFTVRHSGDSIDFARHADTWLVKLMKLLGRGLRHADRAHIFDRCSFVVFNYDRCIEHFFIHALSRFYKIDLQESHLIVNGAKILHAYGTPGSLSGLPKSVPFGAERANWCDLSDNIKTYTEAVDAAEIRETIKKAKKIVFLGFAYHDQNMKLLADDGSLKRKTVIGTALGQSKSDVTVINSQIMRWIEPNETILMDDKIRITNDLTAAQLFDHFSKSI